MTDTIWIPRFELTATALNCLENIERAAWLIQKMLIMPNHELWFQRQVAVRRAAATTRIEGAALAEEEVQALVKKPPSASVTEDERANINALDAYRLIDDLSDDPSVPVNELVVRQLNREFMRDLSEVLTPGKYRTGQNTVGNFMPPDQGDVPQLMREFSAWMERDDGTHPMVRAALAHIEFVAIHPFWDGNGRVARGLATLLVQRSNFHFKRLTSLESYLYRIRDEYFTAIERTLGTRYSRDYDATSWVDFFLESLATHASELQAEMTDWHRNMESVQDEMKAAGISQRQADAVIFAMHIGKLTRAEYMEITGVSDLTASRDLALLVEKGRLVPHGSGRGRFYTTAGAADSERSSAKASR
jgi:Fic family protein